MAGHIRRLSALHGDADHCPAQAVDRYGLSLKLDPSRSAAGARGHPEERLQAQSL